MIVSGTERTEQGRFTTSERRERKKNDEALVDWVACALVDELLFVCFLEIHVSGSGPSRMTRKEKTGRPARWFRRRGIRNIKEDVSLRQIGCEVCCVLPSIRGGDIIGSDQAGPDRIGSKRHHHSCWQAGKQTDGRED